MALTPDMIDARPIPVPEPDPLTVAEAEAALKSIQRDDLQEQVDAAVRVIAADRRCSIEEAQAAVTAEVHAERKRNP